MWDLLRTEFAGSGLYQSDKWLVVYVTVLEITTQWQVKFHLCKVVSWGNHFGKIGNYKLLGEANKNECADDIEDFEKLINS